MATAAHEDHVRRSKVLLDEKGHVPQPLQLVVLVVLAPAAVALSVLTGCSSALPPAQVQAPAASAGASEGSQSITAAARSAPSGRPGVIVGTGVQGDLVDRGKVIFDRTAGGAGCAYCHGLDGKGRAEFASPNIRGKSETDVVNALATRTQMSIVKLSDDEVKAVVAYLGVLASTP